MSLRVWSLNSPPIRVGAPTAITSWLERMKVLAGLFYLLLLLGVLPLPTPSPPAPGAGRDIFRFCRLLVACRVGSTRRKAHLRAVWRAEAVGPVAGPELLRGSRAAPSRWELKVDLDSPHQVTFGRGDLTSGVLGMRGKDAVG